MLNARRKSQAGEREESVGKPLPGGKNHQKKKEGGGTGIEKTIMPMLEERKKRGRAQKS